MSADGSIALVWGDGELHVFRFGIGQFRELQEKVNGRRIAIGAPMVGPMSLVRLLQANDAWPDDVRDVIRIGLLGGSKPSGDVHRLMVNYFDPVAPLNHMRTAFTVLMAGLAGAPEDTDDSKKKTMGKTKTPPSNSHESTEPARH